MKCHSTLRMVIPALCAVTSCQGGEEGARTGTVALSLALSRGSGPALKGMRLEIQFSDQDITSPSFKYKWHETQSFTAAFPRPDETPVNLTWKTSVPFSGGQLRAQATAFDEAGCAIAVGTTRPSARPSSLTTVEPVVSIDLAPLAPPQCDGATWRGPDGGPTDGLAPDRPQEPASPDAAADPPATDAGDARAENSDGPAAGDAQPCDPSAPCPATNPCRRVSGICVEGRQVCAEGEPLADGQSCGQRMVCRGGACAACPEGDICEPNENPCLVGKLSCATGAAVCIEVRMAANGLACGEGKVCKSGDCSTDTCVEDVVCTVDQCTVGKTVCSGGQSHCSPTGNRADGSPCDGEGTCQEGVCRCGEGGFTCSYGTCLTVESSYATKQCCEQVASCYIAYCYGSSNSCRSYAGMTYCCRG
jgi:hypothetical protein